MKFIIKTLIFFVFIFSYIKGYSQPTITSIDITNVTVCKGDNTGEIVINATGDSPFSYSIDDGDNFQASNSFTGLYAGTYTVVVKDKFGVPRNDIAIITEPDLLHIDSENKTNVTGCFGDNNGTISITASGGGGSIEYSIEDPSNFVASGNFTNLIAGNYIVRVKDANGCEKQGIDIEIEQPLEISMNVGANDVIGCHGDSNGKIEFNSSGGSSPLQYSIDNGVSWQAGDLFSSLGPGNYQAVIKDAAGCFSSVENLTITEPDELVIVSEDAFDITTCNQDPTGKITIVATGGTGTLEYGLNGIYDANGGVFTGLLAGTYDIKVRDEFMCLAVGSTLTINQPDEIIITSETTINISTCYGDTTGTIDIVASGGIAPLQYSVDAGGTWQASSSFIVPAGDYNIEVKDANSCVKTGQNHYITQPVKLSLANIYSYDVSTCFGDSNGRLEFSTDGGGTAPYQFSIDGETTYFSEYSIDTLSARTFDLIVKDSHGCKDTVENITIGQPDELIVDNSATILTDPSCYNGANGTLKISASGGSPQLFYSANGGTDYFNSSTISGLSAGVAYNIAVKDSHGCETFGATYSLTQPDELVIDSIVKSDVTNCFGGTNGFIKIYAKGGTPDIEYSIDAAQNFQSSFEFLNLGASNNSIVIKDSHNCNTSGGNISIIQPGQIQVTYQSKIDVLGCKGDSIGEIHFNASGGTLPYTYSIAGSLTDSNNTGDFINLPAGLYLLSVKDFNNCDATGTDMNIQEPDTLIVSEISHDDVDCNGNLNGVIRLSGSGGSESAYRFSIDGGLTMQPNSYFSGYPAGSYPTYIIDGYGCERTGPIIDILQPSTLLIDSVKYVNIEDCFGDDDGVIDVFVSGGAGGYIYSMDYGSYWYNNSGHFVNLEPGKYYMKVKDANNCEVAFLDIDSEIDTILITEPPLLELDSIHTTNIKCYGDDNGIISSFAKGGTGDIYYSINNGVDYNAVANDGDFINLEANTYTLKMKDANDCKSVSYSVSIYEPDSLFINRVVVEDELCLGANDGRIIIYATGGTNPLQYSADGINFQSTRIIKFLSAGTYTPMLRDTNNCIATIDTTVTISSPLDPSIFSTDFSEGCSPLNVQFTRENPGSTYLWEFGDGQISNVNEPSHIFINNTDTIIDYTVIAYSLSPNSCKDTAEMEIKVYPKPQLDFSVTPSNSYFPNNTKEITNNSPAGYLNYLWNFDDGQTSTLENPVSHTYNDCGEYNIKLYAENSFGCNDTLIKTVKIIARIPVARFNVDTTEHCVPYAFSFENTSFYDQTFEWTLSDGTIITDNSFTKFYDTDGVYDIKLKIEGYCNTSDSIIKTIKVHQSPVVDFSVIPDTVMLPAQPIHCYNNSSDDAELFFWEFGDGGTSEEENPIYQYNTAGNFQVKLTVISENKCTDSLTLNTEVIVLPEGNLLFPNAFTPNGDGINDIFKPAVYKSVKSFKMYIYNRWGDQVFFTDDIKTGWTGTYNGKTSSQDSYVWRAEGYYINGTPFEMSGSITLLK